MRLNNQKKKRKLLIVSVIIVVVMVLAVVVGYFVLLQNNSKERNPTDILNIELSARPTKTLYYVGEEFEPQGTSVQVLTYDYDKSYFVDYTKLSFVGFDSSAPVEVQTITVIYQGFTTTFKIEVKEFNIQDKYLVEIRACNLNTTYDLATWNQNGPSYKDAYLELIYSDGSIVEEPILRSMATRREILQAPGKSYITIEYMGKSVVVEFTITE